MGSPHLHPLSLPVVNPMQSIFETLSNINRNKYLWTPENLKKLHMSKQLPPPPNLKHLRPESSPEWSRSKIYNLISPNQAQSQSMTTIELFPGMNARFLEEFCIDRKFFAGKGGKQLWPGSHVHFVLKF